MYKVYYIDNINYIYRRYHTCTQDAVDVVALAVEVDVVVEVDVGAV